MERAGRPQVAVIYHFFPHYRRAVVEALARSVRADFTFVGDDHEYLRSIEPAKLSAKVRFLLAPTHHLFGPFMWQWGAIRWAASRRFDTVIMHSVPHWPCTWIGAVVARLLGKRVLFWGHGWLARPRGVKGLVRRLFYGIPHEHLSYGRLSKAYALETGWPAERLHVIYNSLDLDEQRSIRATIGKDDRSLVRRELFGEPGVPTVICTSRLIGVRRLDLLVEALAELARRGKRTNLILVGDGPEQEALRALAESRGVRAHFEGACYDERRLARLIMASSATVVPGRVGLTAIHSITYGVPVVSHGDPDDQFPEWEAIIPGRTGSHFRRGDVRSLADAIEPWIGMPEPSDSVRQACQSVIDRFWNPTYQLRAIERAVCGEPADDLFDVRQRNG